MCYKRVRPSGFTQFSKDLRSRTQSHARGKKPQSPTGPKPPASNQGPVLVQRAVCPGRKSMVLGEGWVESDSGRSTLQDRTRGDGGVTVGPAGLVEELQLLVGRSAQGHGLAGWEAPALCLVSDSLWDCHTTPQATTVSRPMFSLNCSRRVPPAPSNVLSCFWSS